MFAGLTEAQVEERIKSGKSNQQKVKTTSVSGIIKKHVFTVFNFINIILATLCLVVGAPKNTLFIFIAIVNTLIAIVNDLRAKKIIDKLTLISEKHAHVIRNIAGKNKEIEIKSEDIVKDDIIKYHLGDQIIVDSKVLDGYLEVNESFVTGESNTIRKNIGDKLISGSFVISGNCTAKVTSVGEASFTNKLLKSAKEIKLDKSVLFSTLMKLVRYISYVLVPVGIALYLNQKSISGNNTQIAVTSTISAMLSMIPEGLMLLTSSVLALSAIRLSKKKVLVQDLYSIETLARVDTICLDKTGTLTTGNLKVKDIIPLGRFKKEDISDTISCILANLSDNNSTYNALVKQFGKNSEKKADKIIPFSSERKYSGVIIGDTEYRMGAYEFFTKNRDYIKEEHEYAKEYRVITVSKLKQGKEYIQGFVLLSDEIRSNASSIIKYFYNNDVDVRIISGDNLETIEKICTTVGMKDISAFDLSTEKHHNYNELVSKYNLFARVRPEEKRELVKALEKAGHTVAMTGDGVNDVLALREADCGISIGAGADAAKRVSRLVLLENDFDAVPYIINEGRRTINNVTRSSSLFLSKTIYATILSFAFIFINYAYPYNPLEMSVVNFLLIGAPSFILALEPNFNRVRPNFVRNIIHHSLPTALTIIAMVLSLVIVADVKNFTWGQTIAFSCFLTFLIGFCLIYKISRPLNKLKIALLLAIASVLALVYLIPFVRNFYEFEFIEAKNLPIFSLFVVGCLVLFIFNSWLVILILRHIPDKSN